MTKKERNSKHKRLKSEVILNYLNSKKEPVTTRAIAQVLGRSSKQGVADTEKLLEQLHNQNKITQVRRHRWVIPDASLEVIGTVVGHFDGHGFVLPEQGGEKIFLRAHDMREVLHNDTVKVKITGRGSGKDKKHNKRFGQILDVVKRGNSKIIGRFYHEQGLYFVVPQDQRISQDIFITAENLPKEIPENGQVVICEISRQPSKHFQPVGDVIEVLGDYLAPGMEIEIAINEHQIPNEWPDAIALESDKFPESVDGNQFPERKDLRDLPLVTIDGEDARDFDDAVYCEPLVNGGYRLVVAIADVSHYVLPGSGLDKEGFIRGNSVYFPQRVVPMLPEKLSNGLCSLNPHVDRLCMVCEMTISQRGKISGYQFYEGVFQSHARLTYNQVAAVLAGSNNPNRSTMREQLGTLCKHIDNLHSLYGLLSNARQQRGAMEFETTETTMLFDKQGKIQRIVPVQRNDAHKMIEECMLAANVCSAKFFLEHKLDALYRVHEGPKEEKLNTVRAFLAERGIILLGGDKPEPMHYKAVMDTLGDRPDASVIRTMMLRSMNQAVYQPENKGHFGLDYDAYTHFTSPIRRYPDLLVHRAIRAFVRSEVPSKRVKRVATAKPLKRQQFYPYDIQSLLGKGEQCSMTERRADDASRDVVAWLKCEYLSDRIGERFDGVVSAVTNFGLFVELNDLFVEGLIHISVMDGDYYHFDAAKQRLIGERTHKVHQLGDVVSVVLNKVDLNERRVDLVFEQAQQKKSRKAKTSEVKTESKKIKRKTGGKKKTGYGIRKSRRRK